MDSDTPLDYAQFQLSPRRSHCELFVCGDGKTEKIASGLVKPFVTHLKDAEQQFAQATRSIKLQVERPRKARTWFKKGTLERFVRFVSTPEVLEIVHTFDSEMSQLEGARRIYSQGLEDQLSGPIGEREKLASVSGDVTKKELLRAIDVRLGALKQDLTMACARASAAGFVLDTVSELLPFADHFGARRLNEACEKFSLFCQRHPDLATQHNHHHQQQQQQQQNQQISKSVIAPGDHDIRSSSDSDMSLDYPDENLNASTTTTAPVRNSNKKPSFTHSSSQQQLMPKSSVDQCSVEREGNGPRENEQVKDLVGISPSSSTQPTGGSRRLSVQDRINLFESKQKEQAGGTSVLSGSGGGIGGRTGGRPELRRLSSDVSSSLERSVLRRWSGASDMSIDLGSGNSNHNKKEHESTATVRSDSSSTSFGSSSIQTGSRNEEKDTATSQSTITLEEARPSMLRQKFRSLFKNIDQAEDALVKDEINQGRQSTLLQGKDQVLQENKENIQQSGQSRQQSQCASSSDMSSDTGLDERRTAQTSSTTVSTRVKPIESKAEGKSSAVKQVMLKGKEETQATQTSQVLNRADNAGLEEAAMVSPSSSPSCAGVQGLNAQESISKSQTSRSKEEPESNRRNPFNAEVQVWTGKREVSLSKGIYLASQFPSKSEEISSNHVESSAREVPLRDFPNKVTKETKVRDFTRQDIFVPKLSSNPNDSKRFQNDRDESFAKLQSLALPASGKNMEPLIDTCDSFQSSNETVQITRPMKGNQKLNNDLQTKADELEKLFAEHLLRVPGDLPSTKRGKPVDIARDNHPKHTEKRPQEDLFRQPDDGSTECMSNATEFDANEIFDFVNNHELCIGSKFGDLNFPEDLRGKFYEQYMQKRDMKLRKEWRSTRASKEAKMKAMQDRLEQSRAEMKAKFSGSADRQNSAMLIQRRAEKLRSFSACSAMKTKRQPLKLRREGEEDLEDPMDQISCGLIETLNDSSSKSTIYKKNLSSRSMSSTPRSSSITNNPTLEPTGIGSGRRRIPPENSLVQSVPNFSDLRKENTKPLSGTGKMATRVHSRSNIRSKGSSENVTTVKEDKPRRSQFMRKGSASPIELSDLSSVNSDNLMVEHTDQNLFHKGPELKPFLRKGKGIGPGAGAVIATKKASTPSEKIKSEDDLVGPVEAMSNMVKEGEDFRMLTSDAVSRVDNDSRPSADSVHYEDSESENGEASQLQDDPSSPIAVSSSALKSSGEAIQDSPEESPGSWNSRVHHSFSYVQEASDVDASVDSPIGSPASWNSHPLNQTVDSDAARMRKKWGAAQKPMFINSSLGQSKRDVTKGFKRLLKFGRKNKGQDALLPDWVSASTNSEGDEDPEDSRDTGNHMSDDMPKSRMGFSRYQSAYDGFPEGGLFQDEGHSLGTSIPAPPMNFKPREDHLSGSSLKAPRSFFSLSTFRSKGSESKLR